MTPSELLADYMKNKPKGPMFKPVNPVRFKGLDPGIEYAVVVLRLGGVETFESCEGGEDHSYPEPAVRFHGDFSAGMHALAVVQMHSLPVKALRRVWNIDWPSREVEGPKWELVFTQSPVVPTGSNGMGTT